MLAIAIFTLALVVGQVATHPPPFTMNDDAVELKVKQLPFEMTNPSRVAAGELYQSDMLLTDEQWAAIRERKAISSTSYRWTESGGYPFVPYVFMDAIDQTDVTNAIDHWEEHTCITFGETTNTSQPHLQFLIESGCWSYIGMIYSWNGQEISIGSGCNSLGTVVHEIGHAMGFYHEQSRSDRDDHVVILTENIESGKEGNFDKHVDNNFSVPYDYSSNMHYGQNYFTVNGNPTIVTIDPLAQELIGSRNGLTHRDKLLANRMYGCIDKWIAACGLSSDPCLNDGYTQKNCTCACPPGTSGSNCETVTGDYYEALRDIRSEKITTETTITVKTPMSGGETFVKWIVPPTCKSVTVYFIIGGMESNCYYQYLNVKTEPTDYTGEKLCASDVYDGKTLTSETGIVITTYNNVNYGSSEIIIWQAGVTFEDIAGCSGPDSTTQPPTTTPANPTTTAHPTTTNSPTTTVHPSTTTEAPPPPPKLACVKKPRKKTLTRGHKFTLASPGYPRPYSKNKIKCGWKLKAKWPARLQITCDAFQLRGRDVLKVNRNYFKQANTPPTMVAKWFGITFLSRKRSSAPGFSCVVEAV